MWLIAFVGMLQRNLQIYQRSEIPLSPIFPQIFVWGSCFWLCTPVRVPSVRRLPSLAHNSLTHNSLTHNSLTHNLLNTQLPHTQLSHTQLTHTQLSHTQLSHTQLTHNSLTHNSLTHNSLTHSPITHSPITHNLLTHNSLTHNFVWQVSRLWHWAGSGGALGSRSRGGCLSGGCGTWKHPHSVWQAWHLATSTFTLWQAWQFWHWAGSCGALGSRCRRGCLSHLDASTSIQCGRCGTWRHRNSLCVAGVALMALGWLWWRALIPVVAAPVCVADVACGRIHFVWHAWHSVTSAFTLCGRCGTCGTGLALLARLVPVVAAAVWQAWHLATLIFTLCGRRGTYGMRWLWWHAWFLLSPRLFVWQTWHLEASTSILCGRCGTSRGKRCTYRIGLAPRLCRRRGIIWKHTWRHRNSLCLAGVALMALGWLWWRALFPLSPRLFVWQTWHLEASTSILCGSTWRHWPSLCVAGVPLMALGWLLWRALFPLSPRLFLWRAWRLEASTSILCGTRGIRWHRPSFCVAGVALMALGCLLWRAWFPLSLRLFVWQLKNIHLRSVWQVWHLAWQAWHLWPWAGSGGALVSLSPRLFVWQTWHLEASTSILCGRRGTRRLWPSLCVAGVPLMALGWLLWRALFPLSPRLFLWRAWRLEASTSILCGTRAFGDIDLHFLWQGSFPSSSCTCSRHYVASGCFDARAEKQPFACRRHLRWTVSFHDSPGSSLSAIINCFAAKTRSCREDRPLWSWRNCLWPHMPHSHFAHNSFTHNALTHNWPPQLSRTQLSHTHLFHTICLPPSPRKSHTLSHTQLAHTYNLLTSNSLTHASLSYVPFSHNLPSTISKELTHTFSNT